MQNTGAETVGVVVTVWVETALEQPVYGCDHTGARQSGRKRNYTGG